MNVDDAEARFESMHCTMLVQRPAPRVLVLVVEGSGGDDLGDQVFVALAEHVERDQRVELFVDFRETRGTSLEFSSRLAAWLARHKRDLRHVHVLARSKYVQVTADVMRRFLTLGDTLSVYVDAHDFDAVFNAARDRAPRT